MGKTAKKKLKRRLGCYTYEEWRSPKHRKEFDLLLFDCGQQGIEWVKHVKSK